MFKNLFNKNKYKYLEERLATGQLNWRDKDKILTFDKYHNLKKFIEFLEERDNVQFGLHNEVVNDLSYTLILRQPIYDTNDNVVFNFQFIFISIPEMNTLAFKGAITNYFNPESLNEINEDDTITKTLIDNSKDLSIDEYLKIYTEILTQSLSIKGANPNKYKTKRANNIPCENKEVERRTRERYS